MSQVEHLVRSASRVLAIGIRSDDTMTIARALGARGKLLVIEPERPQALAVRQRLEAAGLSDRVTVMIGPPERYLHKLSGPFDVIVAHLGSGADLDAVRPRLQTLLHDGGTVLSADELSPTVNT